MLARDVRSVRKALEDEVQAAWSAHTEAMKQRQQQEALAMRLELAKKVCLWPVACGMRPGHAACGMWHVMAFGMRMERGDATAPRATPATRGRSLAAARCCPLLPSPRCRHAC